MKPTLHHVLHELKETLSTTGRKEFGYHALRPQEIRLVVLLPGAWRSRIQCELRHEQIKDARYDALSYTWGDATITKIVLLNGHVFRVTAGLEQALRYLRLPNEKRTLWIDAICINQDDVNERNGQVKMMYHIYRKAQAVRAWIGAEREDSDLVILRKLRDITEHIYLSYDLDFKRYLPTNEKQHIWDTQQIIDMFGGSPSLPKIETDKSIISMITESLRNQTGVNSWLNIAVLCMRPYWARVWVQQEILEASKVIVHYGSSSFPFTALFHIERKIKLYTQATFVEGQRTPPHHIMELVRVSCSPVLQITSSAMEADLNDHWLVAVQTGMRNLLNTQYFRKCTDPRDKIFGIVGLISP
jgi:hypothetical protein